MARGIACSDHLENCEEISKIFRTFKYPNRAGKHLKRCGQNKSKQYQECGMYITYHMQY